MSYRSCCYKCVQTGYHLFNSSSAVSWTRWARLSWFLCSQWFSSFQQAALSTRLLSRSLLAGNKLTSLTSRINLRFSIHFGEASVELQSSIEFGLCLQRTACNTTLRPHLWEWNYFVHKFIKKLIELINRSTCGVDRAVVLQADISSLPSNTFFTQATTQQLLILISQLLKFT